MDEQVASNTRTLTVMQAARNRLLTHAPEQVWWCWQYCEGLSRDSAVLCASAEIMLLCVAMKHSSFDVNSSLVCTKGPLSLGCLVICWCCWPNTGKQDVHALRKRECMNNVSLC